MNFYIPIGEDEPYQYVFTPPDGVAHNNLGSETCPVVVHDVRGRESEYSLDKNAFQFVHWPSTETAFTDPEVIRTKYYAEVEELLKSVTGGKRIFIFDHTIRRSAMTETLDNLGARGPVERVHVDQTPEASIARVYRHLPKSAARLLASRVRIINVWRPIAHPVAHTPLALADWRTLARDGADLVVVKLVYPDRVGSTLSVRYSPAMRFYYLADQRPEEVALIKIFDSDLGEGGGGGRTGAASIEVRAIVFDAE
ncbi:hypothetical protein V8D89_001305 [Ganoderma adspersum]